MAPESNRKTSSATMLSFLLKRRRWLIGGVLLTTLILSLLEGLHIAVFFPVFHSLLQTDGLSSPGGPLRFLLSVTQRLPFSDPMVAAVILLLGVTGVKCGFLLLSRYLMARGSSIMQHDIKTDLMQSYANASYAFFLEKKQGQLLYNITGASARVGVLAQKVALLLAEGFKVAVIGALLLAALPLAAFVLLVFGVGYHRFTHHLAQRISYHTGKGRALSGAAQASIANEFFTGIRQVMSFGTQGVWLEKFREQSRIFRDLAVRDAFWLAVPRVILEFSSVVLLFGLLLGLHQFRPELLVENLPLVGIFAVGLLRIMPSLTHLGQLRMEVAGLLPDAEVVYEALTNPDARPAGGARTFRGLSRGIRLDQLSFAYPGKEKLFDRMELFFEQGKTTALVGPSGVGKTTLAQLLLGLLTPTEGRILVDESDLMAHRLDSWRERIGFVSQDLFLFHASVEENIRFGRSSYSLTEVHRATRIANADRFIEELPQGYDTIVGERGMKLSGGQQQRIAIARAILHDPEILIFDEATSFLDTESEKLVQEAIERISKNRTVILIAHRLSTVRGAGKIVVLDQGGVVEEGSHEVLLKEQGRYFQLATVADSGGLR